MLKTNVTKVKKEGEIMVRKVLMLMAIIFVLSACEVQAVVVHSNWVGGEQGEWGNASNWDPNIVPDNIGLTTFVVTIDGGINGSDVGLRQRRTITQLDCYGEVEVAIWPHDWQNEPIELTIYNGLTNHGSLGLWSEGHQMEINSDVTNTTGAMLELGGVEINANLYNLAGATIEVEYENDVDGDLQNEGIVIIPHASDLLVDRNIRNAGLLQLFGGECASYEIFDNNSTGVVMGFGVLFAEQLLRNKGEIYAYGGSLAVLSKGPLSNSGLLSNYPLSSLQIKPAEDVNNYGTIEVNAGGGVVFDSKLNNEPNAVVALLGGTLSATRIKQAAGATFEGQGDISTANLLIETNGLIRLNGPTNIFGNVQIDPNATLEISDGTTLITGRTTCNNGTIHMIGGRIICQGGLTNNNCNIIWEPGTYTNVADFNLDGTVNFKDFADFANTWLWRANWY